MTEKRSEPKSKMLTETELEFMHILWRLGEGTVRDVMRHLPQERGLAYTSISTILRILEQKGVLTVRKHGRGHIYQPLFSREQYERRAMNHIIDKVFLSPVNLVQRLLDTDHMTQDELHAIQSMLNERLDS